MPALTEGNKSTLRNARFSMGLESLELMEKLEGGHVRLTDTNGNQIFLTKGIVAMIRLKAN